MHSGVTDGWRKWVDNIKTNLRGVELVGMDWIYLAQDKDRQWAVMNLAINLRSPRGGFIDSLKSC